MTSGLTWRVLRGRVEVERQQAERDQRHEHQGDLQVGVHHQRRAVQLDELALRVLQRLGIQVGDGRTHNAPRFSVSAYRVRSSQTTQTRPLTRPIERRDAERDDQQPGELWRRHVLLADGLVWKASRHGLASYLAQQPARADARRQHALSARPEKIELVSDGTSRMPTQNVPEDRERLQGVDAVLRLRDRRRQRRDVPEHELLEDHQEGDGHHRNERVLDEGLQPPPEQPIELAAR